MSGNLGSDGAVGFNSTQFTFNPSQSGTIGANQYDFVGTVEHEISEVMGRTSGLDNTGTDYSILDLFRYQAPGVRQFTTNGPSYFSVNGGATNLADFNNFQTGDPQGDLGDWGADLSIDPFAADGGTGVWNPLTSVDKTVMQIYGYSLSNSAAAASLQASVPSLSAASAIATVAAGTNLYVAVSDSAAHVAANLDALESLANGGNLSTISLTDGGIPSLSLTPAQIVNDAAALADISGYYSVSQSVNGSNVTVTGSSAALGNTAVFTGKAASYSFTGSGDGVSFTASSGGSTDHLSNFQALQFSDVTLIVAAAPGSGSVTGGNITELYGAVFGRLPDVAGLSYYENELKANPNIPLTQFAQNFLASPEYTGAHNYAQTTAGDTQFITDAYHNLLGRAPESGAIPYYLNTVIAPFLQGLTPGTQAYTNAEFQAHAQVITFFSQSPEFLGDVQVTGQNASSQHWLVLI